MNKNLLGAMILVCGLANSAMAQFTWPDNQCSAWSLVVRVRLEEIPEGLARQLDRLLQRMMRIILLNAGANRGFLILEAEGDSPNRYKLSKQADTLMLFYLFSAEEVQEPRALSSVGHQVILLRGEARREDRRPVRRFPTGGPQAFTAKYRRPSC